MHVEAAPLPSPLPDQPILQHVPDARKAPLWLFQPVTIGVLALMLGAPVASLLALLNGLQLRRPKLILLALAVGPGSVVLGMLIFGLLASWGVENISLLLLAVRIVYVGAGLLLGWQHWNHVKGHLLLGGRTVHVAATVGIALALIFLLPGRVLVWLEFPWLILLDGTGLDGGGA